MSDFDNKLQEQIKGLINNHLNTFEKEVVSLQQSVQDLVKSSFDKVLETASQGLTDLTKTQDIAKVIEEVTGQLATEKTQLEAENKKLSKENKKLVEEKTELATENEKLAKKKSSLSKEKTELTEQKTQLEAEKATLVTENEKLAAEKAALVAENEKLAAEKTVGSQNKSSTNIAILKVAINEIQANKTQSDVLSALVSQASSFSPRIALFIVKSGNAIGWMARGFSENEQGSTSIKTISIPLQSDTVLRTVLGKQVVFVGNPGAQTENQVLFSKFNSIVPTQILGIPLLVRNKAAAVLYADSSNLLGDVINVEALEILVNMAGLAIELISVRPRSPEGQPIAGMTQALAQAQPVTPVAPVIPPATPIRVSTPTPPEPIKKEDIPVEVTKEPEPIAAQPVIPVVEVPKIEVPPPIAIPTSKIDTPREIKKPDLPPINELPPIVLPPPPVLPSLDEMFLKASSPGVKSDASLKASSPGIKPEVPKIPAPPTWQAPADFSKPLEPLVPPPSIPVPVSHRGANSGPLSVPKRGTTGPLSPPDSGSLAKPIQAKPVPANDEEQKLHNDAKRFARLLVSEIKLYNEQKVLDGRKNNDLYDRLKEDIDRSRQMYDKRVSTLVAAKYDYFYDELVNTLAEGDAGKLGRDCPGPSVQVF